MVKPDNKEARRKTLLFLSIILVLVVAGVLLIYSGISNRVEIEIQPSMQSGEKWGDPVESVQVLLCEDKNSKLSAPKTSSESFDADYPYTVNRGSECHEIIQNPHRWSLVQLDNACGPGVAESGLMEGHLDINQDGTPELFLRCGRGGVYLVFTPVDTGYLYLGDFPATRFRCLSPGKNGHSRILAYERCGGHHAYIKTYEHDGRKFVLIHKEGFTCGDGAPEENNRKLKQFFTNEGHVEFVKSSATATAHTESLLIERWHRIRASVQERVQ